MEPEQRSAETTAERDERADVLVILEAFLRDGEYMADLAARFLDRWCDSLGLKKPVHFPADFLYELAAVVRVACWQRAGLTVAMGEEFPPWQELLRSLLDRLLNNRASFNFDPQKCESALCRRVVRLWYSRCSWTAPSELGVDMLVEAVDLDDLLEVLSNFLPAHQTLAKGES